LLAARREYLSTGLGRLFDGLESDASTSRAFDFCHGPFPLGSFHEIQFAGM
jgi:hypothetical protein